MKTITSQSRIVIRLVIALIFVCINLYTNNKRRYHHYYFKEPIAISNNNNISAYNEVSCNKAIEIAINKLLATSTLLSGGVDTNDYSYYIHLATSIATNTSIHGDIVEVIDVNTVNGGVACSSGNYATLSLFTAIAQRTVFNTPHCKKKKERAIWQIFGNDNCLQHVQDLFHEFEFPITVVNDTSSLYHNYYNERHTNRYFDNNIPIYIIVGEFKKILPDVVVGDIALLNVMVDEKSSRPTPSDLMIPTKTLIALISLYRRVVLGGYISISLDDDRLWNEVNDFFKASNSTDLTVPSSTNNSSTRSRRTLTKKDVIIHISKTLRDEVVKEMFYQKVQDAWSKLDEWHKSNRVAGKFFGHIGNNVFQSYRYAEAMRHVVQLQMEKSAAAVIKEGEQTQTTINVCETGFNGGHSAMLFLSFMDKDNGINVNYWGYDLKEVGASGRTAEIMAKEYGDNFHITWGDSKETLLKVEDIMAGEECHLIVIDGEHSYTGVVHDVGNFLKVAAPAALMFADDCSLTKNSRVPVSISMLKGWEEYVKEGILLPVANYQNARLGSPGFVEGIVSKDDGAELEIEAKYK